MAKTYQTLTDELKQALLQGKDLYLVLSGHEHHTGSVMPLYALRLAEVAKYNTAAFGCMTVAFDVPVLTVPVDTTFYTAQYCTKRADGGWEVLCRIDMRVPHVICSAGSNFHLKNLEIEVT